MSVGWGPFFLVLGIIVLAFTVGGMIRRKSSGAARGDGKEGDAPGETDTRPGADLMKADLDRHLERRIRVLETLIEEADDRIRRLSSAIERDERRSSKGDDK